MENREEIIIEVIKPEEYIEEINLLDGGSVKIELPPQDDIIPGINEKEMILEGFDENESSYSNSHSNQTSLETHFCMICNQIFLTGNDLITHFIDKHSDNQTTASSLSTLYTPTVCPSTTHTIEVQKMNLGEISNETSTDVLDRAGNEIIGEFIIPQKGRRKLKCKDCDFIAESKYFLTKHRTIHRNPNQEVGRYKGQRSNVCKEQEFTKRSILQFPILECIFRGFYIRTAVFRGKVNMSYLNTEEIHIYQ